MRDPRRRPLLVVVTDGRATHGVDPLVRAHKVAAHLADSGVASVVVDCETGRFRLGLGRRLADHLRAEHVPLEDVSAEALADVVRGEEPLWSTDAPGLGAGPWAADRPA